LLIRKGNLEHGLDFSILNEREKGGDELRSCESSERAEKLTVAGSTFQTKSMLRKEKRK